MTETELVEIWRACEDDDYGRIVRLLILSGQRKTEIGDLVWPEIDKGKRQIDLPAEPTKNHRAHLVPLCDETVAIVDRIKRRKERELICGRGKGGFSGWSKAKAELDVRIAAARVKAGIKKPLPAWRLHDLRRSLSRTSTSAGLRNPMTSPIPD